MEQDLNLMKTEIHHPCINQIREFSIGHLGSSYGSDYKVQDQ
jgi:hypothetical protein